MQPFILGVVFSISFTACTTVNLRQGYLLRNPKSISSAVDSVELPQAYGADDVLQFENLPITIRLSQKPKDSVISTGPLILSSRWIVLALPVIPWPPGIVKSFRAPAEWKKNATDKLHVIVAFVSDKPYPYGYPIDDNPEKLKFPFDLPKISPFTFNPMKVYVRTKDNTYSPSSFSTKGYLGGDTSKQLVKSTSDQPLEFTVGQGSKEGVIFDIAFDIPYSFVRSATLDIGEVGTQRGPLRLPDSEIRRMKKFKLWVMAGV